jgi:lipopolysaccharide transport system permease protein
VNQLSQLLIYTYVFSIVLNVKLSLKGLPPNNITFGLWLFAGLLPWIAFTGGLSQAAGSVVNQPNLVKKVVFPLGLLPLVPILATFIESSFGLMALIVLVAAVTHTLHPTLGLLPIVWLPQLLLTAGLGILGCESDGVFARYSPDTRSYIKSLVLFNTDCLSSIGNSRKMESLGFLVESNDGDRGSVSGLNISGKGETLG